MIADYTLDVSHDVCNTMHRDGSLLFLGRHQIISLQPNSSSRHSLTLAERLTVDGSCKGSTGAGFTDAFGSWNDVTVSASVQIPLSDYDVASLFGDDIIILPSGVRCVYSWGHYNDYENGFHLRRNRDSLEKLMLFT